MKSEEYERIVSQIVASIFEHVEHVRPERVVYGRENHETGASGFSHQIDISIHGAKDVLLVECKYWARRISAQCVLEFASRLCDIAHATTDPAFLKGIIITKNGVQPGADVLAKYFKIELGVVRLMESVGVARRRRIRGTYLMALVTPRLLLASRIAEAVRNHF